MLDDVVGVRPRRAGGAEGADLLLVRPILVVVVVVVLGLERREVAVSVPRQLLAVTVEVAARGRGRLLRRGGRGGRPPRRPRNVDRPRRRREGLVRQSGPTAATGPRLVVVVGHLELHLHVVRGALAAEPSVQVPVGRGRYEVVVLAGVKLHAVGGRREGPERDGEVHELVRLGALRDHPGVGAHDAAGVVLLLVDAVDDVGLHLVGQRAPLVERADDIDLIVLPRLVAAVDVDDVVGVVYPKYGVARVPVHVVALLQAEATRQRRQDTL